MTSYCDIHNPGHFATCRTLPHKGCNRLQAPEHMSLHSRSHNRWPLGTGLNILVGWATRRVVLLTLVQTFTFIVVLTVVLIIDALGARGWHIGKLKTLVATRTTELSCELLLAVCSLATGILPPPLARWVFLPSVKMTFLRTVWHRRV